MLMHDPFVGIGSMTRKNNVDRQVTSSLEIKTLSYYCNATSRIFLYSSSVYSVCPLFSYLVLITLIESISVYGLNFAIDEQ